MLLYLLSHIIVFSSIVNASSVSNSQKVLHAGIPEANAGPLGPCDPQQYSVDFESAEHQSLGDLLLLNVDIVNRTGAKFGYPLGVNSLSFGQIVAMADFYSNSSFPNTCNTQISDPGFSLQQRKALFDGVLQRLQEAKTDPTTLDCITAVMAGQSIDTRSAADPAQCFAARNAGLGGWDFQYGRCTLTYLSTALCNWDHFGQDAIAAFTAGHASALEAAQRASGPLDLFHAYFIEAFAQHYLTDLFSAGHLRAPRRALHSTMLVGLELYPGDQCFKRMHDEDSANGLWVRNALGEAWPMYGDKQLFASKSNINRDQALKAMQASADEVYQVYKSKMPVDPSDFVALSMIPVLNQLHQPQNYYPMFAVSEDGKNLLQRMNLDDRSKSQMTSYSLKDLKNDQSKWSPINSATADAGVVTNMYPRTVQLFTPESNLTHIRQWNASHLVLNRYGPVWTRLYTYSPRQTKLRSWNMLEQFIGPTNLNLSSKTASVAWQFVQALSSDTFILIGAAGSDLVHLGIKTSATDDTLMGVWSKTYPGMAECQFSDYTIGHLGSDSDSIAILRSCGSGSSLMHEIYVAYDLSKPPDLATSWNSSSSSQPQALVLHSKGASPVYVEAEYDSKNNMIYWSFTTFGSSYHLHNTSHFTEVSTLPNQHYIVDSQPASADTRRVIRVQYEPTKFQIKVDVLKVMVDVPDVRIFQEQPVVFDMASCASLDWFSMDVSGDSRNDLVGYCPKGSEIQVITFIQQSNGGFGQPQTTTISNDFAQDFTGNHLKHVKAFATDRFAPYTQRPLGSKNSILQLFDNYGILGARLLAPSMDVPRVYEPVGQYPAIAGQISQALGPDGLGYILD